MAEHKTPEQRISDLEVRLGKIEVLSKIAGPIGAVLVLILGGSTFSLHSQLAEIREAARSAELDAEKAAVSAKDSAKNSETAVSTAKEATKKANEALRPMENQQARLLQQLRATGDKQVSRVESQATTSVAKLQDGADKAVQRAADAFNERAAEIVQSLSILKTTVSTMNTDLGNRITDLNTTLGSRITGLNTTLGTRISGQGTTLGNRIVGLDNDLKKLRRSTFKRAEWCFDSLCRDRHNGKASVCLSVADGSIPSSEDNYICFYN